MGIGGLEEGPMVEAGVSQPAIEAFSDVEGAPGVPALEDGSGHSGNDGDSGSNDPFDRLDEAAKEPEVGEDVSEGLKIVV